MMQVLPVTVAMGIVQRGIMAGKSGGSLLVQLCPHYFSHSLLLLLTEWANGSDNPQWLSVAASFHVLCDLKDLASHL